MNKTKAKKTIKKVAKKSNIKKPAVSSAKKNNTKKPSKTKSIVIKVPVTKKITKKSKIKAPKISKKNTIEEFSEEDANVLEESFELIKTLNMQVGNVQDAKEKLSQDMKRLDTRLSRHEENTKNLFQNKFLLTVKEEIIKEFTPILSKLDYKSLKVDVFKEIEQIIEIEIQKVKTEFDSKTRKNSSNITSKVSELEIRLVDALKANENIKRELKKFEKKEVSQILNEFETKIHISLENTTKNSLSIFNTTSKEIENFKKELFEQKKITENLSKSIAEFKKQTESLVSKDGVDLTSVESKILKVEKEISSYKTLIEKYENDLYNRKKDETFEVETRVKKTLKETENTLLQIKTEKKAHEDFMIAKINEVIENVNSFEEKVSDYEQKSLSNSKIEITKKADELKLSLLKNIEKTQQELNEKGTAKLTTAITEFNSEKTTLEKDLEFFKIEVSTLIKNYITELDNELKILKINSSKNDPKTNLKEFDNKLQIFKKEINQSINELQGEKRKEKDEISQKAKELLKSYSEASRKINEENKIIKKALEVELHYQIEEHLNTSQQQISKQLFTLNELGVKLSTENKEDKRNISEDIESKFVLAKQQYETEFKTHLESFETELKTKENEFLEKLEIIEKDKNEMLKELENFKVEISSLTKNYLNKLDEELKYIKNVEANFDDRKEDFLKEIDSLGKIKKIEIEEYAKIEKNTISDILNKEKENFEMHENTFRDIFNEKITLLHENTKKRLDTLDKKFLDKNIKVIDDRILESKKELELMLDNFNSKSDELNKKLEMIDKKEADFYSQLDSEIHAFNQKSEDRLGSLEKQFNKRFLDYDSNFSNFKGVVVDEVEDLIKDINSIMNTKIENFDKNIAKLSFINNEAANKLNDFKKIQETLENDLRDVRDDINDLKVKFEITLPQNQTLSDHVRYMSEYETQLIALIKSLKDKGVSNSSIKMALINKGHPRFYVSLILENYEQILNY